MVIINLYFAEFLDKKLIVNYCARSNKTNHVFSAIACRVGAGIQLFQNTQTS